MAVKYRIGVSDIHGVNYRIDIDDTDYTGTTIYITNQVIANSIQLDWKGGRDDIYNSIISSKLSLKLIENSVGTQDVSGTQTDWNVVFDDFQLNESATGYKLSLYKLNSSNVVTSTLFVGFLNTEKIKYQLETNKDFTSANFGNRLVKIIQLEAVDSLTLINDNSISVLKKEQFQTNRTYESTALRSIITDRFNIDSCLDVLAICLNHSGFTKIFNVASSFYDIRDDDNAHDPFARADISFAYNRMWAIFYDDDGDMREIKEIMSDFLSFFHLKIFEKGGEYYIVHKSLYGNYDAKASIIADDTKNIRTEIETRLDAGNKEREQFTKVTYSGLTPGTPATTISTIGLLAGDDSTDRDFVFADTPMVDNYKRYYGLIYELDNQKTTQNLFQNGSFQEPSRVESLADPDQINVGFGILNTDDLNTASLVRSKNELLNTNILLQNRFYSLVRDERPSVISGSNAAAFSRDQLHYAVDDINIPFATQTVPAFSNKYVLKFSFRYRFETYNVHTQKPRLQVYFYNYSGEGYLNSAVNSNLRYWYYDGGTNDRLIFSNTSNPLTNTPLATINSTDDKWHEYEKEIEMEFTDSNPPSISHFQKLVRLVIRAHNLSVTGNTGSVAEINIDDVKLQFMSVQEQITGTNKPASHETFYNSIEQVSTDVYWRNDSQNENENTKHTKEYRSANRDRVYKINTSVFDCSYLPPLINVISGCTFRFCRAVDLKAKSLDSTYKYLSVDEMTARAILNDMRNKGRVDTAVAARNTELSITGKYFNLTTTLHLHDEVDISPLNKLTLAIPSDTSNRMRTPEGLIIDEMSLNLINKQVRVKAHMPNSSEDEQSGYYQKTEKLE